MAGSWETYALQPQRAIPAGVDSDLYRQFLEWKNGMGPEPAEQLDVRDGTGRTGA